MQRAMLLERLPDSLSSLAADATFLTMLKRNCSLPPDPSWTEADTTLQMYTDAAEAWIDFFTGTTFRPRNFNLTVQYVRPSQLVSIPSEISGRWYVLPIGRFSTITLPVRPVTTAPTIAWAKDDAGASGSFVLGTDYVFTGGQSVTPEITFLPISPNAWPMVGTVPWPFVISFTTAANTNLVAIQKLAIMQLASYYYHNPQGMGEDTPDLEGGFWGLLSALDGSWL